MDVKRTLLISLLLLWTSGIAEKVDTDLDFTVPTITPKGSEQYLNLDSDYIFDQESLHTFELKIPSNALAEIDADPAAEENVEGMLIFKGDTVSPVGIRYKGDIGAFVGCLSGKDVFDPSGEKICTKLSMKVSINWEGRDDKFYGLKKLQFHSQNLDPSQMHERLGYWLFRSMGVPAPRSVHARLIINDEYSGLYALTEQVDGQFTRYNFDDGEGNLYKEVWPLQSNGEPQKDQELYDALKTNEDEGPSLDIIKSFGQKIARADSSQLQSVIADYMDVNEIISYAVVDRAIRNDDGAFHWYTDKGGSKNHNYYWYEEPGSQRLHLIPWDVDNAFDNLAYQNPITAIADGWGETTNNCEPFPYGEWQIWQWSASCDKITKGWASYTEEYDQLKAEFSNTFLDEGYSLIDTWAAQIRNATLEAEKEHDDALSTEKWERATELLKSQIFLMKIRIAK